MASVTFTRIGQTVRGPVYQAQYNPSGDDLPKRTQMKAADMLKPRAGQRGYVPRGTDTNAPRCR